MMSRGSIPARPVLVSNPSAAGHDEARQVLLARASQAGWPRMQEVHTTPDDFGAAMTRQALAAGADLVVAGGGDGIVRTVAGTLAGSGVPMAVLPLGTANIFARNLGLHPRRIDRAVGVAIGGTECGVDLGTVRLDDAEVHHPFLVMAGIGRDAETIGTLDPRLKKAHGWVSYLEAGLHHLADPPVPMAVQVDDEGFDAGRYWSLLLGNAGRIPGGIEVFPGSRLDDGRLSVLAVAVSQWPHWLAVAGSVVHPRLGGSTVLRRTARRVLVRLDEPALVQVDGDLHGPVGVVLVELWPAAVRVRTPGPRIPRRHPAAPLSTAPAPPPEGMTHD